MSKSNGKVSVVKSATTIMTPTHPGWGKFLMELDAAVRAEGCDSVSCRLSRRLIDRMDGVDVKGSIAFFQEHDGFCDCEVLMNVERHGPPKKPLPPFNVVGRPSLSENELKWRRSRLAWIAYSPETASIFNMPIEAPVPLAVQSLGTSLLRIGGKDACIPFNVPSGFYEQLIAEGASFPPSAKKMEGGSFKKGSSYRGASSRKRGQCEILVTAGFSLDDDGCWRSSVWFMCEHGHILREAVQSRAHFGMVLGDQNKNPFRDILEEL